MNPWSPGSSARGFFCSLIVNQEPARNSLHKRAKGDGANSDFQPGQPNLGTIAGMRLFRAFISLLRGTCDDDAFTDYKARLLKWAADAQRLTPEEYQRDFADRYTDGTGRDLFLDYLLSVSKDAPSYITDHAGILSDRRKLFDRFGLPILTMRELRDQENQRLKRMQSPLRL